MAAQSGSDRKTLFNNPTLSDVKLLQTSSNGQTIEYYAHRAILCESSGYFMTAFTSQFKEATEPAMELKDDDQNLFRVMLEYAYSHKYNGESIQDSEDGSSLGNLLAIIRLYSLAEKYDLPGLREATADHFQSSCSYPSPEDWVKIVRLYYEVCIKVDGPMGRKVAHSIYRFSIFAKTDIFKELVKEFPEFAIDLVLQSTRNNGRIWPS
ncbi:hypothetical protein BDV96DRAFT_681599 [Lophiotrema nucula]|uniref:BTB domain-containing protein n=1 Tax=Lophiotrema nucula TaxID=690887 RepID=A0A6A5ZXI4_9PLEO|nr:hypothetical protein BDV96DRAFT_681599 [Lophiotrema nucula]